MIPEIIRVLKEFVEEADTRGHVRSISSVMAEVQKKRSESGREMEHQRFPTRSVSDPEAIRRFAVEAARTLADDKCEDVVCLDVRELSQVADYIVIASGSSDRQMRSSADDVEKLARESGYGIFRRSDDDRATWLVLDCVDVVVHVFEPNTRAHYDLEMLWADAERVEWIRTKSAATPGVKKRSTRS